MKSLMIADDTHKRLKLFAVNNDREIKDVTEEAIGFYLDNNVDKAEKEIIEKEL